MRQLIDLAAQFHVVGTLREERLVNAQRILLVTLLQVQLRHRFCDDWFRPRQGRGVGGTIVVRQRDRRRYT